MKFTGKSEVDISIFNGVLHWKLKGISYNPPRSSGNKDYAPQYQTWYLPIKTYQVLYQDLGLY